MNIQYDIPVEKWTTSKRSEEVKAFDEFLESDHTSILFECDDIKNAVRVQKKLNEQISNHEIVGVYVHRRKEKVWVVKE
jgi:hypothetical protein